MVITKTSFKSLLNHKYVHVEIVCEYVLCVSNEETNNPYIPCKCPGCERESCPLSSGLHGALLTSRV